MDAEQQIKQIADEAIKKIRAIAAEKDEWPGHGDEFLYVNVVGDILGRTWDDDAYYKKLKARRRIAPNTPEGRARLERLAEWEVFFADFMTAGDAEPGVKAHYVENSCRTGGLHFDIYNFGTLGQRGFTTESKLNEWLNKWGCDYVEKMLKGGMP